MRKGQSPRHTGPAASHPTRVRDSRGDGRSQGQVFPYSHGTAKALTQRGGTGPSGWRREEGICPQPAGRDSRLTSLPGAAPGCPEPPRGGDGACSPRCSPQPGVWWSGCSHRMGAGGRRKVTITLFLLVLFLATFLFLFVYFVVGLLLPVFLVLLGKTKHHLKICTGEGRKGGRDVEQQRTSPPFLPKAPARWSPRRASRFLPASTQRRQPRHEGSGL